MCYVVTVARITMRGMDGQKKKFGDFLQACRGARKLSKKKLRRLTSPHVSEITITDYEERDTPPERIDTLGAIAEVFGVTASELIEDWQAGKSYTVPRERAISAGVQVRIRAYTDGIPVERWLEGLCNWLDGLDDAARLIVLRVIHGAQLAGPTEPPEEPIHFIRGELPPTRPQLPVSDEPKPQTRQQKSPLRVPRPAGPDQSK